MSTLWTFFFVLHGATVPHSYNSGLSLPFLDLLGNKLPLLSGPLLGSCVFIIKPIIPCDHNSTKETELPRTKYNDCRSSCIPWAGAYKCHTWEMCSVFFFRRLKFSSEKRELAANRVWRQKLFIFFKGQIMSEEESLQVVNS